MSKCGARNCRCKLPSLNIKILVISHCKILGANIGVKDAKDLIAGKETGEKEFTWKSGKKGKASLKLDGEKNIKFVFK